MLKNDKLDDDSKIKDFKAKAKQVKQEGHPYERPELKKGNIGTYQKTKKMAFDPDTSKLTA